jgi:hypothetical protein
LVEEGVLKKYIVKKGEGSDDLVNLAYKCNFDSNFIEEVAKKIDFRLNDFLLVNDTEE